MGYKVGNFCHLLAYSCRPFDNSQLVAKQVIGRLDLEFIVDVSSFVSHYSDFE